MLNQIDVAIMDGEEQMRKGYYSSPCVLVRQLEYRKGKSPGHGEGRGVWGEENTF